ncbi:thioredoxin domain-containing protein [Marinobacterium jannaschii]|uniref:thioredoxin domain-containing protein n=1 Tax=Marinobacterium jannaschii TaxID=64970 RepID=UPI0006864C71|nr:thioredoxin domain-containing protein [Marinobacterium jannaschii]
MNHANPRGGSGAVASGRNTLSSSGQAGARRMSRNRLADSSSPYLLQHAANPVLWHPWDEQAFLLAQNSQRPIFLSIGYATCHWCHVMARESFEDPAIASFLNHHFVPVKVDREQLPDVDNYYMIACSLLSGQGGWPLSAFLTPEGKPFYAATYWPPQQFIHYLSQIHQLWLNSRDQLEREAEQVITTIRELNQPEKASGHASIALTRDAVEQLQESFDNKHGGFSSAPKFPREAALHLLLDWAIRKGDRRCWQQVQNSLDSMVRGALFDHIGGGFHRYTTDRQWQLPHFEKMLFNQAQLSALYLRSWQLSGNRLHRHAAELTLQFVLQQMRRKDGLFYSAIDADSEGSEGRYYSWSRKELARSLSGAECQRATGMLQLNIIPELENRSLFTLRRGIAEQLAEDPEALRFLDGIRQRLQQLRQQRIAPLIDDKIVTAWNAMMISTLAEAALQLGERQYHQAAERAATALWHQHRVKDNQLWRDSRDGRHGVIASQEDYAWFCRACLAVYDLTEDECWLQRAEELNQEMREHFWDNSSGGFFLSDNNPLLPGPSRQLDDNAYPAGNSVAYEVLLMLNQRTGKPHYLHRADQLLNNMQANVLRYPSAYSYLLRVLAQRLEGGRESLQYGAAGALWLSLRRRRNRFELSLSLQEGWHLQAHNSPTEQRMGLQLNISGADIDYPEANDSECVDGKVIPLYSGRVLVRGKLNAISTPAPLLQVRYQACNQRHCLPPEIRVMQL